MATLAQFARNMRRYADNIDRNATKVQRTVAIAILSHVVPATPVGNPSIWKGGSGRAPPGYVGGRARGNWQVGLGGAKNNIIARPDPSGNTTIGSGKASIEQSTKGQPIHLTNNVTYIGELNDGSSRQAPAGFVQSSVQSGVAAVSSVKMLGS